MNISFCKHNKKIKFGIILAKTQRIIFMSYATSPPGPLSERNLTPRPPLREKPHPPGPLSKGEGGWGRRGGVSAAAKKFNCVTPNFIKRFFFAPFAVFARKNIFARNRFRQGESA